MPLLLLSFASCTSSALQTKTPIWNWGLSLEADVTAHDLNVSCALWYRVASGAISLSCIYEASDMWCVLEADIAQFSSVRCLALVR